MKEKLSRLYGTLYTVETKGESTVSMAMALKFLHDLITQCDDDVDEKKEG